jgi:hypothetical protein
MHSSAGKAPARAWRPRRIGVGVCRAGSQMGRMCISGPSPLSLSLSLYLSANRPLLLTLTGLQGRLQIPCDHLPGTANRKVRRDAGDARGKRTTRPMRRPSRRADCGGDGELGGDGFGVDAERESGGSGEAPKGRDSTPGDGGVRPGAAAATRRREGRRSECGKGVI